MLNRIFSISIFLAFTYLCSSCSENKPYKLRTDGYYFSYDRIRFTENDSVAKKHHAMILYEDSTLSNFYHLSSSEEDFLKILDYKSYSELKELSKFGTYKIVGDSIYIDYKTQRISGHFYNYNPQLNAKMKGVIQSHESFKIIETEVEGKKYYPNHTFKFVESDRGLTTPQ